MSKAIEKISKGFGYWEMVLVYIGALCTLVIMVLTTVDVVGRNLFAFSIRGCSELVALLLLPGFVGAIPYVQSKRGHVFLEVATTKAPPVVNYILDIFGIVVGGYIFISITPTSFTALMSSITKSEISSGTIGFALWPFKTVLFLTIVTLSVRLILDFVSDIVNAKRNVSAKKAENQKEPPADPEKEKV